MCLSSFSPHLHTPKGLTHIFLPDPDPGDQVLSLWQTKAPQKTRLKPKKKKPQTKKPRVHPHTYSKWAVKGERPKRGKTRKERAPLVITRTGRSKPRELETNNGMPRMFEGSHFSRKWNMTSGEKSKIQLTVMKTRRFRKK